MSSNDPQLFSQFMKKYWNLSRNMSYQWRIIFERRFPGSQSHILFLLDRNGRQKMSEIADSLHRTPGAVTSSSDKLIENGYIARIRDEKDRRVVYLDITEKGKQALTELQNEGLKTMKLVFSNLSDTDMEFLIQTFEHANKNIDEMRKEND